MRDGVTARGVWELSRSHGAGATGRPRGPHHRGVTLFFLRVNSELRRPLQRVAGEISDRMREICVRLRMFPHAGWNYKPEPRPSAGIAAVSVVRLLQGTHEAF